MRLLLVTLWVLAGGSAAGGAYWAFLNTPESTVWALGASAVLLAAALALAGATVNGAILLWTRGPSRHALVQALLRAPAVVPAALIVIAIWWLTAQAEAWVTMRSGPISAWFIARLGWADVSWLFAGVGYVAVWTRWVLAVMLATWLMAAIVHGAKHRLSLKGIGLASVWFVLLIALPWIYLVPWRPAALPPTSMEIAFIGVKLFVAAAVIAGGLALVIREASPRPEAP